MAEVSIYSVDEVIGKSLYALKQVVARRTPDQLSTVVGIVNTGQHVGSVYSYVLVGTQIWWQFISQNGGYYYTLHEKGTYSIKALAAQGAKTEEEKIAEKEAENMSVWDKFVLSLSSGANYLIIFLVLAIIIYVIVKSGILEKNKK